MPRYAIVIEDADLAYAREIERNVNAHAKRPQDRVRVERIIRQVIGPKRAAGEVHAEASSECPNGLPNCRNCGDPEHAATCKAAGHCPDCGTKHGIAPDRILRENGYRLEAVD